MQTIRYRYNTPFICSFYYSFYTIYSCLYLPYKSIISYVSHKIFVSTLHNHFITRFTQNICVCLYLTNSFYHTFHTKYFPLYLSCRTHSSRSGPVIHMHVRNSRQLARLPHILQKTVTKVHLKQVG